MILFAPNGAPARRVLDPHKPAHMARVRVLRWVPLETQRGLAFVQPRSVARVLAYTRMIGPVATARKIAARLHAPTHDQRETALFLGVILDPDDAHTFPVGAHVVGLAPLSLPRPERLVSPPQLLARWQGDTPATLRLHPIDTFVRHATQKYTDQIKHLKEKNIYTYKNVTTTEIEPALTALMRDALSSPSVPAHATSAVAERRAASALTRSARPDAILFGYGHHAKTALMPHIRRRLALRCVHDIDPTKLPDRAPFALDTSPTPRLDEDAALFIAAGWHHTHAAIACHALERGRYALIEKPAVTSLAALARLSDTLAAQPVPRLFVAYHKRYAAETAYLCEDLALDGADTPLHYHATVHVVRLPPRHWYRWPESGSRLLSNGCHYIDHFLMLNGWSAPERWGALPAPAGAAHVWATLQNGAWFTLTLSEHGSDRLGTREVITITRGERTARICDGRYQCEDGARVLRAARLDRMAPYKRMIDHVVDTIERGGPADALDALRHTHTLALALEAEASALVTHDERPR
jgi:predicted dehydrogenase